MPGGDREGPSTVNVPQWNYNPYKDEMARRNVSLGDLWNQYNYGYQQYLSNPSLSNAFKGWNWSEVTNPITDRTSYLPSDVWNVLNTGNWGGGNENYQGVSVSPQEYAILNAINQYDPVYKAYSEYTSPTATVSAEPTDYTITVMNPDTGRMERYEPNTGKWYPLSSSTGAAVEPGPFDELFADPDKYATRTTAYTGLPPEVIAQVQGMLGKTAPLIDQYSKLLGSLASPASFISAYGPTYKALIQKDIKNLAERGILDSEIAKETLAETSNKLPLAYIQKLGEIAETMKGGAGLYSDLLGNLKYSASESVSPSGYELMARILGAL